MVPSHRRLSLTPYIHTYTQGFHRRKSPQFKPADSRMRLSAALINTCRYGTNVSSFVRYIRAIGTDTQTGMADSAVDAPATFLGAVPGGGSGQGGPHPFGLVGKYRTTRGWEARRAVQV